MNKKPPARRLRAKTSRKIGGGNSHWLGGR
jgi:hypothetical protein